MTNLDKLNEGLLKAYESRDNLKVQLETAENQVSALKAMIAGFGFASEEDDDDERSISKPH